ncbi:MAG: methylated-DNA--[protein]-cysteine S-methyltransferase [Solirubrobacteraceae bacterium]
MTKDDHHDGTRVGAVATRLSIETPIGRLVLVGDEAALTHVQLPGTTARRSTPGAVPAPLRTAAVQLEEYFSGKRRAFALPLAPHGTAFQLSVWKNLAEIPYGETITYGELARRVGRPSAPRAVGQANGANPLPIVYPCHRVVAAGGRLGGYGGGLETKRRLLALEGVPPLSS